LKKHAEVVTPVMRRAAQWILPSFFFTARHGAKRG